MNTDNHRHKAIIIYFSTELVISICISNPTCHFITPCWEISLFSLENGMSLDIAWCLTNSSSKCPLGTSCTGQFWIIASVLTLGSYCDPKQWLLCTREEHMKMWGQGLPFPSMHICVISCALHMILTLTVHITIQEQWRAQEHLYSPACFPNRIEIPSMDR